jgi:DNA-binding NtrC family response regulator
MFVFSGAPMTDRVLEAAQRKNITFILKANEGLRKLIPILEEKILTDHQQRENLSPEMIFLLKQTERIIDAKTDSPILITGETGTGKEYLAKFIAGKTNKKLTAINMATIPKETAESLLFGHEKGAFTGAVTSKIGLFEQANHGILFLDEIGECDRSVQSKILRAIQEKQIQPLGSNRIVKVNFQLIVATHRNLLAMCETGEFRLDLYQRLNTFLLEIPPLRKRICEISHLAKNFLKDLGHSELVLSNCAINKLESYVWPGNIRELKNVTERIAAFAYKNLIDQHFVEYCIRQGSKDEDSNSNENLLSERDLICKKLKENKGNKHKAAKALKMGRTSIYRKIEYYNIKEEEYC